MSLALAFGGAAIGMLAAPHLIAGERLSPIIGILLWSSVLLLRAALAVCVVVALVFLIPATQLFTLLTHWCFHAVIPFFATHLGFSGHSLGDAAVIVPAVVTAASLLSVGVGAWRGARAVSNWLKRSSLGPGPNSSVIVSGSDVVVAAAGFRSPRVVVSAGALLRLDDDELNAGLQHEWGHVVRGHRFVSLLGRACQGLSRFLPGGRRALKELDRHLERDADDYAVRKTGDPLALASAICKAAAGPARPRGPALASLAGEGLPDRLRRLSSPGAGPRRSMNMLSGALAIGLIVASLTLASAVPAIASSGTGQGSPLAAAAHCE